MGPKILVLQPPHDDFPEGVESSRGAGLRKTAKGGQAAQLRAEFCDRNVAGSGEGGAACEVDAELPDLDEILSRVVGPNVVHLIIAMPHEEVRGAGRRGRRPIEITGDQGLKAEAGQTWGCETYRSGGPACEHCGSFQGVHGGACFIG